MIIPEFLHDNDVVGIVSPAGKIDFDAVKPGIEMVEKEGFKVLMGKHVVNSWNQFAGTDKQRADDFQQMIDNPDVKAIICARGGYGSIRILPKLNWSKFKENPKWIIGFSDITAIHAFMAKNEIASIHAAMPRSYYDENSHPTQSFLDLIEILQGNQLRTIVGKHALNRIGEAEGELIGGNLSMIYSLAGTPYDINTKGEILFIEDLNEKLYHLDRMMMNLKLSGKLDRLAGLIVGGFTDMQDNDTPYGKSAYEIIAEHVKEYEYPVCFDYPVGHQERNSPLVSGLSAKLEVNKAESELLQVFDNCNTKLPSGAT